MAVSSASRILAQTPNWTLARKAVDNRSTKGYILPVYCKTTIAQL